MRRRLDLAAALVVRPPVMFMDEPTTGLDPRNRQQLWEVIRELVAGGDRLRGARDKLTGGAGRGFHFGSAGPGEFEGCRGGLASHPGGFAREWDEDDRQFEVDDATCSSDGRKYDLN